MNPETVVFHMHAHIGQMARILEWKPEDGSYDAPMGRVTAFFNVPSVSMVPADQVQTLLAVAEAEVWREVVTGTASFHSLSTADGERRERRQIHENAQKMYEDAAARVRGLEGTGAVEVRQMPRSPDPYAPGRFIPTARWNWWDR